MFESLFFDDQWRQIFNGLDGIGVGTLFGRGQPPSVYCHLHGFTQNA
jgi:hypothetical protein